MARKDRTINSMEDLMKAVPQIIDAVNADPVLALRFAANPLFLAEEMGYTLNPEMMHFAARRVRFPSAETFERLVKLEAQVWKIADERFDLDSDQDLARVLFVKLELPRPPIQTPEQTAQQPARKSRKTKMPPKPEPISPSELKAVLPLAAPLDARVIGHEPIPDPLEPLRDAHPIMPPLLEFRQLDASAARLAPRRVYDRIARGDVKLPITSLKLRFKPSSQQPQ
ncbi:MAG TPA: hypothetical protein PKD09_22475 [Aggregatilinea sp.]|uniref:hypothetical protein n=1 Tax=Aggregatilinea sp. TaxID=2806333 RepID=UPI002CB9E001|nr:hypothetical protein [Aggregatilinea sp.]HML24437.1 hypothetical protein [Aggregatilinea sp.]